MVVGEPPDGFGSIEQLDATLHQGLLDLLYLLEEPVGHGFVAERPQPLRRLQLGRTGGEELQVYPVWHLHLAPVCHPALSTTSRMRRFLPAPTSSANSLNAKENTSVFTVGRIIQKSFPLWGWTKP